MTEHTAADIWREIKRYVNPTDRAEAAETVVSVMIDDDSDPDVMRSAFASDADLKRALQGYLDNDRGYDDDEEYVEEDDSDSDWDLIMWYNRVVADLGAIPDFIAHYEAELAHAKSECRISGHVETNIKELPGVTEHRFNQLQEIEAVLNYLNIQLRKIRRRHFKKYLEGYARALTSRDAEKYVDGEDEV